MSRFTLLVAAFLLAGTLPDVAAGQERYVHIETNQPNANVFAGDVWLGVASRSPFAIPDGAASIVITPPGLDTWSIQPIRHALAADDPDTVQVQAVFPYHYKFETIPLDVRVIHLADGERSQLGTAPLLYKSESPLEGRFVFERDGYRAEERESRSEIWNRYLIELELQNELAARSPDMSLGTGSSRNRRWIDVAALGTALTAGVLAIHYRTKADNRFDEWRETGDPRLKDDIQRLDVRSGVALGTMQVGLGVFAIRLAF